MGLSLALFRILEMYVGVSEGLDGNRSFAI